jgi:hypothetical protein
MIVPDGVLRPPASGVSPWSTTQYSFAGWVPNVSGHLSFSQVDPRGRQGTFNHQADLDSARTIVVHRSRLVQDYPFWNWLVRLIRPSAKADFLMLAESGAAVAPHRQNGAIAAVDDDHGALNGVLLVLPNDDQRLSRGARRDLLKKVDAGIADALTRRALGLISPGERVASEVLREVNACRPRVACLIMRFALFRTGECRIWFDLPEFFGRDVVAEPPTLDELIIAEALPKQAYYFVKDLLHAHYHHDPNSDQILQLTRVSSASATPAQTSRDEVRWRYVTLRGLVRVVVELRQGRSLHGHKRALGIVAYASAFQSLLGCIVRTPGGPDAFGSDDRLMPYQFDNLVKSIEATDSSLETVTTSRLQLFAILVGIFLSALALWAGAVQIQPILCAAKDITCPKIGAGPIVSTVNDVVANPLGFTVLLLALGFVFFIAFFRGTGTIPYAERFVRWLKGFGQAIASDVAKFRGYDTLGWVFALIVLASLFSFTARLAYKLVPKTHVPPVQVQPPSPGPWSKLQNYVGKPVNTSGLFTSSVAAQTLRSVLGQDFYAHMKALEGAPLKRDQDIYYALSASPGDDGGYIVLDATTGRMEGVFRTDGHPHPHRSPGGVTRVPAEVQAFVRASGVSDIDPVPVEAPKCDALQGGKNGSTLQFQGSMRVGDPCAYNIPLQSGQTLSFNTKRAAGLVLAIAGNGIERQFAPEFTAASSGNYVVRIGWSGPRQVSRRVSQLKPFYVRMNIK